MAQQVFLIAPARWRLSSTCTATGSSVRLRQVSFDVANGLSYVPIRPFMLGLPTGCRDFDGGRTRSCKGNARPLRATVSGGSGVRFDIQVSPLINKLRQPLKLSQGSRRRYRLLIRHCGRPLVLFLRTERHRNSMSARGAQYGPNKHSMASCFHLTLSARLQKRPQPA